MNKASWQVVVADCVEYLRTLPENSLDSCVCDPPYGLEFMGKEWDRLWDDPYDAKPGGRVGSDGVLRAKTQMTSANFATPRYAAGATAEAWHLRWATEVFRVLKPGGHLLAFGGTRTYHRLACAVEDAGFEIRDTINWVYASGFPKSHNVGKAADKASGSERESRHFDLADRGAVPVARNGRCPDCGKWLFAADPCACPRDNGPQSEAGEVWDGWGTALKPAHEPILVARKPLIGTVVENVLKFGTGALNIDATRVGTIAGKPWGGVHPHRGKFPGWEVDTDLVPAPEPSSLGRWPPNLVLTHSPDCRQEGTKTIPPLAHRLMGHGDSGGASRFFPTFSWDVEEVSFIYEPKASRSEREEGLGSLETRNFGQSGGAQNALAAGEETYIQEGNIGLNRIKKVKNHHPTVKPIALLRWLCRLVTPPGGTVLDPFAGSGSCGCAAVVEGFDYVGVEKEPDYAEIAKARVAYWKSRPVSQAPTNSLVPSRRPSITLLDFGTAEAQD